MAESRHKRVCRRPERCQNYYLSEMIEIVSVKDADGPSEVKHALTYSLHFLEFSLLVVALKCI